MSTGAGTPGGTSKTYEPRREARVLRWAVEGAAEDDPQALSLEQKQVGEQLHQLLRKLAEQPAKKRPEAKGVRRFLPPIDEVRENQVLLLDGARGSGKTALLVTVLDLWSAITLGEVKAGDPKQADRLAQMNGWGIELNGWPIVPVGMLDLQPLPAHTPVLLRIVESLVRVVEAIEGEGTGTGAAPWHLAEEAPCKSRKSWVALMHSIVAGWDHASPERWGKLDAEQTFHELDRAVRQYGDLPTCFEAFVENLVEDFTKSQRWTQKHGPLFVLAIDDADMVPERAAEVLDALRLLYHPRVAFLLTGDSELFYRSREEAAAKTLPSARSGSDPNALSFASRLGRDIYDKVVPPSHRCLIASIPQARRRSHVEELARLSFPASRGPNERASLGWLLEHPIVSEALPERIRALRELALVGRPLRREEDDDRAVGRIVLHLWETSLANAALSSTLRAHGQNLVQRTEEGASIRVEARGLNPSVWFAPREPTRSDGINYGSAETIDRATVVIEQGYVAAPSKDAVESLPKEAVGALVLADNVAFEDKRRRVLGGKAARSSFAPFGAHARYEHAGREGSLLFAWPLPEGRRLLDLCNFCLRWDLLLRAGRDGDAVDRAARWFVTLWGQMAATHAEAPVPLRGEKPRDAPPWSDVATQVVAVVKEDRFEEDDDGAAYHIWALGQVLLLAAPESGLPHGHAAIMLNSFQTAAGASLWKRMLERAVQERLKRAEHVLGVKGKDPHAVGLLNEIDRRSAGHPWHTFTNPPRAVAPVDKRDEQVQRFIQSLGNRGIYGDRSPALISDNLRRLSEEELATIEDLSSMLESPVREATETGDLLKGLWDAATTQLGYDKLADFVMSDVAGKPFLKPIHGHFFGPAPTRGVVGRLTLRDAEQYELTLDEKALPPLLQFLFPVIWDAVEAPISDTSFQPAFSDTLWTFRISHEHPVVGVHVPWPATPWRCFSKYQRERRYWNEGLSNYVGARKYATNVERLSGRASLRFLITFCSFLDEPQQDNWHDGWDVKYGTRDAINRAVRAPNIDKTQPRRLENFERLYTTWAYGAALLLAPESGAADSFRGALLEALKAVSPEHHSSLYQQVFADVDALRARRVERMQYAIAHARPKRQGSPMEILATLDAGLPADDPWHLLLDWIGSLKSAPKS